MQCCWGSLQSAQALCWQPADHGRRLGIFSSGLHRIRGSVSLIYNIRKQRSLSHTHTHTHTLPSNPDLCLRLGTALCPGGGQRVAEAVPAMPTHGLVGTAPSPRWRPQRRRLCCVRCLPVWGGDGLEHVRVCIRVGCFFVCSAPVLLIDLIRWPFQVRGQHTVTPGPTLVSLNKDSSERCTLSLLQTARDGTHVSSAETSSCTGPVWPTAPRISAI